MNKRIALKTALICSGLFIILTALTVFYFSTNYQLDTEKRVEVVTAAIDIRAGDVIAAGMVTTRAIKESAMTPYMLTNLKQCTGKKTLNPIRAGDYLADYALLPSEKWHDPEDKIIIIPMDIEGRLANLIRKGALIDIRMLPKDVPSLPETVLSRVSIEDILDENGLSLGDNIGSKKAYAVVVLDKRQRDRIYASVQLGKLMFELYCDSTQKEAVEDFVIPDEFIKGVITDIPPEAAVSTDKNSGKIPGEGGN